MATNISPPSASSSQLEPTNGPSIMILGGGISYRLTILSILSGADMDDDDSEMVFLDKPANTNLSPSGNAVVKTAHWRGDRNLPFTIFLFENEEDNLVADIFNTKHSLNAFLLILEEGVEPSSTLRSTINILGAVFGHTFWEHLIIISPKWPCKEYCQEGSNCAFQWMWSNHKQKWNTALTQWFPQLAKALEIYCLNNVWKMGLEGSVHNDIFHKKLLSKMCSLLWDSLRQKSCLRNSCEESLSTEKDSLTSQIKELQANITALHEEIEANKQELRAKDEQLHQKDVEKSVLDIDVQRARQEADNKIQIAKEESDGLRINVKVMETQLSEFNDMKHELNEVKIQRAVAERERDIEKQRADNLQRKNDDMNKEEKGEEEQKLSEFNAMKHELNEVKTQRAVAERERDMEKQRADNLQRKIDDMNKEEKEEEEQKHAQELVEKFPAAWHPDADSPTLGETLKQQCEPFEVIGSRGIFKVPLQKNGVIKDDNNKVVAKKFILPGVKNNGKDTKTILELGMTGAGKSTFIDAFINFVLDVRLTDDHRFKLVELTEDEVNKQKNQAVSQTDTICVYELEWQEGFNIPYNLVIIDTPGFCDTRGIARDKQLQKDLKHVFNKKKGGVEAINAVCFIMKASDARFTAEQQFMYESVFSIFGYDIEGNIFVVLTHDDGQEPAALHALIEAEMPYSMHFVCNSKAVFAGLQSEATGDAKFSLNDAVIFQRLYDNCNEFFKQLTVVKNKSMEMSTTVMNHRERIETEIEGLQTRVKRLLHKKDVLRQETAICQQHDMEIRANKNFTYEVEAVKIVEVTLDPGKYVTNCLECNFTCHYPCRYENNEDKEHCNAMRDGSCIVCEQKCHWSKHRNTSFRIDTVTEKVTKTYEEVRARYKKYLEKHKGQKSVVDAIEHETKKLSEQIQDHIQRIAGCLHQLSLIELKPKRSAVKEYIERMIQSEEQAQKPGYLARIEQLKLEKQRAEQIQKIQDGGSWDELGITVPGMNKDKPTYVIRQRVRNQAAALGREEYPGYQHASPGFVKGTIQNFRNFFKI